MSRGTIVGLLATLPGWSFAVAITAAYYADGNHDVCERTPEPFWNSAWFAVVPLDAAVVALTVLVRRSPSRRWVVPACALLLGWSGWFFLKALLKICGLEF